MDKISADVLLYICDFLDSDSLQNAMEVCKNWQDIIVMSKSINSKIFLKMNACTSSKLANRALNYPYSRVTITSNTSHGYKFPSLIDDNEDDDSLPNIEFVFLENVESVFQIYNERLNVLELTNLNNFFVARMLIRCPNIKELKLSSVNEKRLNKNLLSQDIDTPNVIPLRQLRVLSVRSSSDIFSRIEAQNVESLTLHDDAGNEVTRNFLAVNWDLKELNVHDFNLRIVRRPRQFKFKLQRLSVKVKYNMNLFRSMINNRLAFEMIMQQMRDNYRENIEIIGDIHGHHRAYMQHVDRFRNEIQQNQQLFASNCLLNFINQHRRSLVDFTLSIDGLNKQAGRLMDIFMTDFQLTRMSLKSSYPKLHLTIANPNRRLKSFEMHGTANFYDMQELCKNLPEITKLTLFLDNYYSDDMLAVIAANMKNLKTLELNTFFMTVEDSVCLPSVLFLKIKQVNTQFGRQVWHKIAMACPNVVNLKLSDNNFEVACSDVKAVLNKLKQLDLLELVGKSEMNNIEDVCKVLMELDSPLKDVRFIGPIDKDLFFENIKDVTNSIRTRIVVMESKK